MTEAQGELERCQRAIARQAVTILALQDQVSDYEKRLSNIVSLLVCCGRGPLNDNTLKFNKAQMGLCYEILKEAEL